MTTSFVRKKLDSYRELGQPLAYHLGRTRGLGWLTLYFFLTLNPVIEYINSKLINKTGVLIDWDIDVLFQESGWHLNSAALSIMLAISFPIFISVYSYISGENSLVQEYIKKHFHRRDILNLLYGSLLLLFTHSLLYVIPFYLYGFFVLFNKTFHYYRLLFERESVVKEMILESLTETRKSFNDFDVALRKTDRVAAEIFAEEELLGEKIGYDLSRMIFLSSSENASSVNEGNLKKSFSAIKKILSENCGEDSVYAFELSEGRRKSVNMVFRLDQSVLDDKVKMINEKIEGLVNFVDCFYYTSVIDSKGIVKKLSTFMLNAFYAKDFEKAKEIFMILSELLKNSAYKDVFLRSMINLNYDIFNRFNDYPKSKFLSSHLYTYWYNCLWAIKDFKERDLIQTTFFNLYGAIKAEIFGKPQTDQLDRDITSFFRGDFEETYAFEFVASVVEVSLDAARNGDIDISAELIKFIKFLSEDSDPDNGNYAYDGDTYDPSLNKLISQEGLLLHLGYRLKEDAEREEILGLVNAIDLKCFLHVASHALASSSDRWFLRRLENTKFNRHGIAGGSASSMFKTLVDVFKEIIEIKGPNSTKIIRIPKISTNNLSFLKTIESADNTPSDLKESLKNRIDLYGEETLAKLQASPISEVKLKIFLDSISSQYQSVEKASNLFKVETQEDFAEPNYGFKSYVNKDYFVEDGPPNDSLARIFGEDLIHKENLVVVDLIKKFVTEKPVSPIIVEEVFKFLSEYSLDSYDFLFFGNPQIFRFNNFDNEGVCNFNKKIVFKSFSENKEYINLTVNDKQVQILNLNLRTNEENFIIVVPNVKRPVINMLTPFVSEVGARTETFLNNHRCVLENFDTDEKVNNLVNKTNKDQKFFKEHVMIHLYGAASPGPNWEKVKLLHWKDSYR